MNFRKLIGLGLASMVSVSALHAQNGPRSPDMPYNGWQWECIDPNQDITGTFPYSGYSLAGNLNNALIGMKLGAGGTITWGGGDPFFCYGNARTLEASGRFCFYVGPTGSVQSDFDDGLNLTVGAPNDAAGDYCYARVIRYSDPAAGDDTKTVLFGGGGLNGFFQGVSNRYCVAIFRDALVDVNLECSVIGDAARLRWRLTNIGTEAQLMGLKFGAYVGMKTAPDENGFPRFDATGAFQANSLLGTRSGGAKANAGPNDIVPYIGFTNTTVTKPLRTEHNFLQSLSDFPAYCNFLFGQTDAYGIRIDNGPFDETPDASRVTQFIIGNHGAFQSPNLLMNNNMNSRVFGDPGAGDPILSANPSPIKRDSDTDLTETSFVQTFQPISVAPGSFRDVIHYIRSPWSVGDYRRPYAALVDAPRLVATNAQGVNGLDPNPLRIVAYVDNQYAVIYNEVPLQQVRLTIDLPEGGGLTLASGESAVKVINTIDPNQIASVEWQVEADGQAFGKLPYSVKIEPTPGPTRTLNGTVLVSATPRLRLAEGANLVTLPWKFADSSLDSILGLVSGVDYLAYRWDPDLGEYVQTNTVTRGQGLWLVPLSDLGYHILIGAQTPTDTVNGGMLYTLRPGWNMVGNPYNYPIPLSQLVAVAEDDPANALTWQDLVDNALVSPSLAFWQRSPDDPTSGTYGFTEGSSDVLQPNTGYWIYVASFQPIRISWPAVFIEGLPGSYRSAKSGSTFKQSDKQWRLQLSARTNDSADLNNYVGVAENAKAAKTHRIYEPPKSPSQKIELSIDSVVDGKPARLAQSLAEKKGKNEWKVLVKNAEPGDVTITWPNISTIGRNVRFQLVDKGSNVTRDLRFVSSYTYRAEQAGTREFVIQMEPGGASKAVIGNVIVTRPTKDPRSPFTINYSLSAQANTTIRILGGSGKEVFTVTRGRSDKAGENTATWTMRDNANRAVAPGSYRVEIVAETATGERVRKIVPVNVVR